MLKVDLLKDQIRGVTERHLGPEQLENGVIINWDGEGCKFWNSYQKLSSGCWLQVAI